VRSQPEYGAASTGGQAVPQFALANKVESRQGASPDEQAQNLKTAQARFDDDSKGERQPYGSIKDENSFQ